MVLTDLAEFVHFVTRLKIVPDAAGEASVTEVERVRGQACTALPMRVLSRAWQMLSKGIVEVQASPKPLAAAEMVLVRLAYAADLPTPDEALRLLAQNGGAGGGGASSGGSSAGGGASGGATSSGASGAGSFGGGARAVSNGAPRASAQPEHAATAQERPASNLSIATRSEPQAAASPASNAAPAMRLARFEDLVALAVEKRDIKMQDRAGARRPAGALRGRAAGVRRHRGRSPQLAADISKRLSEWTGRRWIVALSSEAGQTTLREKADAEERDRMTGVRADPLVRAVLERFPGAQIVGIRDMAPAVPETSGPDEDGLVTDAPFDFDGIDDDDL